jgi:hypothetical protein
MKSENGTGDGSREQVPLDHDELVKVLHSR